MGSAEAWRAVAIRREKAAAGVLSVLGVLCLAATLTGSSANRA